MRMERILTMLDNLYYEGYKDHKHEQDYDPRSNNAYRLLLEELSGDFEIKPGLQVKCVDGIWYFYADDEEIRPLTGGERYIIRSLGAKA